MRHGRFEPSIGRLTMFTYGMNDTVELCTTSNFKNCVRKTCIQRSHKNIYENYVKVRQFVDRNLDANLSSSWMLSPEAPRIIQGELGGQRLGLVGSDFVVALSAKFCQRKTRQVWTIWQN